MVVADGVLLLEETLLPQEQRCGIENRSTRGVSAGDYENKGGPNGATCGRAPQGQTLIGALMERWANHRVPLPAKRHYLMATENWRILPRNIDEDDGRAVKPLFATNALWNETKVFARMLYKAKNQHRTTKYFHIFQQLHRSLKRLARLERWLDLHYEADRRELVFIGYVDVTRMLVKNARADCVRVGAECEADLERQFFVSLMRLAQAAAARIFMLLGELDAAMQAVYAECVRKASFEAREQLKAHGLPEISSLPEATAIRASVISKRAPVNLEKDVSVPKKHRSLKADKTKPASPSVVVSSAKKSQKEQIKTASDEIDEIFKDFI